MGRRSIRIAAALVLGAGLGGMFHPALANAQNSPAPAASPGPLATAEGETSGMQVRVTQLKIVGGDTLMLAFTLANNSDNAFNMGAGRNSLSTGDFGSDVEAVTLVDLANKKKYEVIRDADKNCLCSGNLQNIAAKGSLRLWAKFPAPPDSVEKIEVNVPHFMPMDDVPISR